MSKLITKLNQLSRNRLAPIGFGKGATPEKPRILVIASLNHENLNNSAKAVSGADAVLASSRTGSELKAIQKASQATPDIPWGARLEGNNHIDIKQLVKANIDFLVFSTESSLELTQTEEIGKILEIGTSINDRQLVTLSKLPVDAVLSTGEHPSEIPLTWHHLMLFQYFSSLQTKPLLVQAPSTLADYELRALWEAGVKGIIVETGTEPDLSALRQTIDKTDFSVRRKEERVDAFLPRISTEKEIPVEEEEEEE